MAGSSSAYLVSSTLGNTFALFPLPPLPLSHLGLFLRHICILLLTPHLYSGSTFHLKCPSATLPSAGLPKPIVDLQNKSFHVEMIVTPQVLIKEIRSCPVPV